MTLFIEINFLSSSSFGLRIRNIIQDTPLSFISACSQTYLILYPWNFKRITCLQIFNGFNNLNAPLNVLQSFFAAHRQIYCNYIDIYTDGSKTGNSVGCGNVCQKTILTNQPTLILFSFLS